MLTWSNSATIGSDSATTPVGQYNYTGRRVALLSDPVVVLPDPVVVLSGPRGFAARP